MKRSFESFRFIGLGVVASVLLAACGSDPAPAPATDAGPTRMDARTTDGGPTPSDAPSFPGRVSGIVAAGEMGVSGATVEVFGASPPISTTTGADGAWSFMVMPGRTIFLRASKATYRTTQLGLMTGDIGDTDLSLDLVASADVSQLFSSLSLTEATTAGHLVTTFRMAGGARAVPAGFGVTLSAGAGTRVAIGSGPPVRQDTTLAGMFAVLLVLNVAPGMTTVTPTPPAGLTCAPITHTLNAVRVDPQVFTYVTFECQ